MTAWSMVRPIFAHQPLKVAVPQLERVPRQLLLPLHAVVLRLLPRLLHGVECGLLYRL